VNAKHSSSVVLVMAKDLGPYRATVRDCQGMVVSTATVRLRPGAQAITVPISGLLSLQRSAEP
jgi:hypothetical protein